MINDKISLFINQSLNNKLRSIVLLLYLYLLFVLIYNRLKLFFSILYSIILSIYLLYSIILYINILKQQISRKCVPSRKSSLIDKLPSTSVHSISCHTLLGAIFSGTHIFRYVNTFDVNSFYYCPPKE